MDPQRFCRQICKRSGSSFVYAFYLLPRKRRRALEAFYAFCRLVDDVVDQKQEVGLALQQLRDWRQKVTLLYEGRPNHPVMQVLALTVQRLQIPRIYFEEIIAGCEMDLTRKSYETFADLEQYCYRVASCVGLVSLYLFEVEPSETAKQAAIDLGKALQVTNIVRDVATDYALGRIYLPQQDLRRCHVVPEMFSNPMEFELPLTDLLYVQISRARDFFARAWSGLQAPSKEKKKWIAAIAMGRIYEQLLEKISRHPLKVFGGTVSVGREEKLTIIGRLWLQLYLNL